GHIMPRQAPVRSPQKVTALSHQPPCSRPPEFGILKDLGHKFVRSRPGGARELYDTRKSNDYHRDSLNRHCARSRATAKPLESAPEPKALFHSGRSSSRFFARSIHRQIDCSKRGCSKSNRAHNTKDDLVSH